MLHSPPRMALSAKGKSVCNTLRLPGKPSSPPTSQDITGIFQDSGTVGRKKKTVISTREPQSVHHDFLMDSICMSFETERAIVSIRVASAVAMAAVAGGIMNVLKSMLWSWRVGCFEEGLRCSNDAAFCVLSH